MNLGNLFINKCTFNLQVINTKDLISKNFLNIYPLIKMF